MRLSNETYDRLNKLHRSALVIAELISIASLVVTALTEQGVVIPSICSIVIGVAQVVIGRLLIISSANYWKEQGDV